MTLPPIPKIEPRRVNTGKLFAEVAFADRHRKSPCLSWGALLELIRYDFHCMTQAELAKMLSTKQEYISRWERGVYPVPQTIRTWLVMVLLQRLDDGKMLPLVQGLPQPNRNYRQQQLMRWHDTFGGKGKTRKKTAKAA